MSSPLSRDLRLRAVAAVAEGASHVSAAKRFGVSVSSVRRWCRLETETGDVEPLPLQPDDPCRRLRLVRRWLKKHPHLTTDQIYERLLKEGHIVSRSTVWRIIAGKTGHPTKRRKPRKATNAGRKRFYLTREQLESIRHFFPKPRGRPPVSHWRVVSGIIHVQITGMPWSEAPSEYGPWKTLYNRWKRWCDKGIFLTILLALASKGKKKRVLMLDSTHIKVHRIACSLGLLPKGQGRQIGRTAGGLNCKLHVLTDAAGRPLLLLLTAGNTSDIRGAEALLDDLPQEAKFLLADRA